MNNEDEGKGYTDWHQQQQQIAIKKSQLRCWEADSKILDALIECGIEDMQIWHEALEKAGEIS